MRGMRFAERLFRWSLHSFPRGFRARHGHAMRDMFAAQWEERGAGPRLSRVGFLVSLMFDTTWSGVRERLGTIVKLGHLKETKKATSGAGGSRWTPALHLAVRSLARRPLFAVLAIVTLSVGIGGVTSIGSVAYHVLLKPLDYRDGDEIIQLWRNGKIARPTNTDHWSASVFLIEHFLQNNRTAREFTWISRQTQGTLLTPEGAERQQVGTAAPNFFEFLGVQPALGRLSVPDDGISEGIVLGHDEWTRRWRADPTILGRSLDLSSGVREVVGVLPPDFEFVVRTNGRERADYWILGVLPQRPDSYYYDSFVKPVEGASFEELRHDFGRSVYADQMNYPAFEPLLSPEEAATAEYLRDSALGSLEYRVRFLLGAVSFVLLLASLSVSNLLLGRLAEREHEIGVRVALGATRRDVITLFAAEAGLLSAGSAALGLLLGYWGTGAIRTFAPAGIPRISQAGLSPEIVISAVLIAGLLSFLITLLPAAGIWRGRVPAISLRQVEGRGRRSARSRHFLIGGQISLATVLLIGSGLLLQSLIAMSTLDLGYSPEGKVAGRFLLPTDYWEQEEFQFSGRDSNITINHPTDRIRADIELLRERVDAIRGVWATTIARQIPLSGSYGAWSPFLPEGTEDLPREEQPGGTSANWVMSDFFAVMGLELQRGRYFTEEENRLGARRVAVVSDALAQWAWPGQDPIGKRFVYWETEFRADGTADPDKQVWVEVVGIVGSLRESDIKESERSVYLPFGPGFVSDPYPRRSVSVFAEAEQGQSAAALVPEIRSAFSSVFPGIAFTHLEPMEETASRWLTEPRFYSSLLSAFAVYGLILALVGIVGVTLQQVGRRHREVALRLALGALPADVLVLFGKDTTRTALVGIALGLLIAGTSTHLMESLLFDVAPLDPLSFVGVPVLFLAVAVGAAFASARHATTIRPAEALTAE